MALTVEVVYALADRQDLSIVQLPAGATLGDAIRRSGVLERHPEIDLSTQKIGIFGKPANPQARLADADRVEIYRPLAMDPKEARRRRAASEKKKRSV
jgi:putative ubiquitin-RnfH superfamily antitoxin RatB of RatAB toxin-antitoxin module